MDKYQFDFSSNVANIGIRIEKENAVHAIIQKLLRSRPKNRDEAIGHHLHCIAHSLRDFMYVEDGNSVQTHFYATLKEVTESVKNVYDLLAKKSTAACIKLHEKGKEPISVTTYCRDSASFDRSGADKHRDASTPIHENTDFQILYDTPEKRSVFIGHNLREQHEKNLYLNSHDDFWRYYQSTVVWPIRAFRPESNDIDIVGYLCVDSMHPRAFVKEDINIGSSIADALYVPIEFYSEIFH